MNGTVATIVARDRAIRHGGSTGRVYERERDFALLGWLIPCYTGENRLDEVEVVNRTVYEYESLLYGAGETGGAYVIFPYDIRKEFGRGRVKVHATFDGEEYDGSIVNMGVKNADGSVCYIIGVRKEIRSRIGKQPGDSVRVTVRERV